MELGNVAHKYYLLNIRLPVNERNKINVGIGEIKDIRLVVSSVCVCVIGCWKRDSMKSNLFTKYLRSLNVLYFCLET